MTNLHKIIKLYNVQTHNKELVKELLKNHLPKSYTDDIKRVVKKSHPGISSQTIRNVKCGRAKDVIIFEALISLASKNHQASLRISETLNQRT